jgi:hypothetical protein
MNFKSFTIILFLVTGFTFAQTIEKLKTETRKIYDANYNMDFDTIAKLSYPKIVAHFGNQKFLDKLDKDYQNEEYRMRLQLVAPVFEYGPIKQIEGVTFCVIAYKNPVRYFFETKLDSNTSLLKANFLREKDRIRDVLFEPKRNSFNVRRISKLIAVADASTDNEWRFFNMDDVAQRELFETFFEDSVKKQVGY